MEWKTLQAKLYNLNLNDLLDDKFIKKLNQEFDNKIIEVVNIQIAVMDNEDGGNSKNELISLSNLTTEDCILNSPIIDVNLEENFDKIKKVIDEL